MFLEIISNSNYHLDYQPQPTPLPTWPPMPPLTLLLELLLEVFSFSFHLCSLLPLYISSSITYIPISSLFTSIPLYFSFDHFYPFLSHLSSLLIIQICSLLSLTLITLHFVFVNSFHFTFHLCSLLLAPSGALIAIPTY